MTELQAIQTRVAMARGHAMPKHDWDKFVESDSRVLLTIVKQLIDTYGNGDLESTISFFRCKANKLNGYAHGERCGMLADALMRLL